MLSSGGAVTATSLDRSPSVLLAELDDALTLLKYDMATLMGSRAPALLNGRQVGEPVSSMGAHRSRVVSVVAASSPGNNDERLHAISRPAASARANIKELSTSNGAMTNLVT